MVAMRGFLILSIIAMLSVTGEALKCVRGSYIGYPSADDKILEIDVCGPQKLACGLAVFTWSNGAVSTERACAVNIHPADVHRSVANNATLDSCSMFFCHSDLCNQTPPANSHDHAHSIAPNIMILFLTSCALLLSIKNF